MVENISTKKGRENWVKKKNLFDLTPGVKLLLLVLFYNKQMKNLLKISLVLKNSYSFLNNKMKLLEKLKLIKTKKVGRTNIYKITKGGEEFCKDFLLMLK